MTRGVLIAVWLAIATWLGSAPAELRGCAPAPRSGETVDVADETALVVWDDLKDEEHFIRQATFVGTAHDFGFLVPTPTRPHVEAADPSIFHELARVTEPRTEYRTETGLSFSCSSSQTVNADKAAAGSERNGVVVLEQKRVGNLDAAILAFRADKTGKIEDTADELLDWLTSRGYAVRPDLTEWLATYIDRKWIITAFKIAGQPGAESPAPGASIAVKSSTVRLSFKTDRPFFPYREPAAQRDAQSRNIPRALRVYVAAKERMAGTIGESVPWPAQTVWANAIHESDRTTLLDLLKLPHETGVGKWWITEFEDHSTPRPGSDEVYFERSMDRGPVARAPIIVTTYKTPWWAGPLAIVLLIALGGAGLMFIRRYTGGDEDEPKLDVPPPLPETPSSKTVDRSPRPDPRRWS
jgi:hypothetical protein